MSVEAASIIAAERAIQAADFTKALEELKPLAKEAIQLNYAASFKI